MLRWAVLGTGFISNTVIEAIARSDGSRVDLVVGRNPESVHDMQSRHAIDRGSVSFDEAVGDPNIDAVYIGLPNHTHHELTVAASAAGKAVLSEKSLTTTMVDAHTLVDAVRANGTFFVEGLMYLAHPTMSRFVSILGDGRLGTLRSINAGYAANIAAVVNPAGGGTLYNLGCYPMSLTHLVVQAMFGDDAFADRDMVALGSINSDGNVSQAAATMRFGCGVFASVHSTDDYGTASHFSVVGDNGVLRFVTNPWLPVAGANVIEWTSFDGASELITIDDPEDAFFHQTRLVERCVSSGALEANRPSPRLNDSLEIMQALTDWEAICRSNP